MWQENSMKTRKAIAGTNLEQAKSHNRRVVFEAVRSHGELSRAEIARVTALSSQTASNIVEELVAAGLLRAEPMRKPRRGQPAIPYSINPAGAYSIGLQLDHQLLIGVVIDLAGKVCFRAEQAVDRPTPEVALPILTRMVHDLRDGAGLSTESVLGIGFAMPGPFGVEGMTSVGPTTLPGWRDFPIAEELYKQTGRQVTVENDANAAAIGERLYGVARKLNDFVYIFIGTGLGAGMFLNGHLYRGTRRNAGEIGHMTVMPNGLPCGCGSHGCLECYVSLRAAYEFLSLPDLDHASPSQLEEMIARNDTRMVQWIADAVTPLRRAIHNLELMFDPEAIILGGFMPLSVIERILAALDPLPISVSSYAERSVARLLAGAAGRDTAVLGAAALPIFGEFNPQFDVLLKPHDGGTALPG
jgi:predicted NBD/HSP70 family sugar kinase